MLAAAECAAGHDGLTRFVARRVQSMEASYESVLTDALDTMANKVEQARDK